LFSLQVRFIGEDLSDIVIKSDQAKRNRTFAADKVKETNVKRKGNVRQIALSCLLLEMLTKTSADEIKTTRVACKQSCQADTRRSIQRKPKNISRGNLERKRTKKKKSQ